MLLRVATDLVATRIDQIQPVDATPACWTNNNYSLNASAGV